MISRDSFGQRLDLASHTFGLHALTFSLTTGCRARGPNVDFFVNLNKILKVNPEKVLKC